MTQNSLSKKVAILATDYFEEVELTSPMLILREAGCRVEVVAPHSGEIKALKYVRPGVIIGVDRTLDKARPQEYDAVVVPGGVVNVDHLRVEKKAQRFVSAMIEAGKPTAVICHGPWLLVSAGSVRGKRLTSYYTIQDDIRNAGGEWVDEPVVEDGCLITSRKPDDLPAFNKALLQALSVK